MKYLTKTSDFVAKPNDDEILETILITLPKNLGTVFGLIKITEKPTDTKERLINIINEHLKRLADTVSEQVNVPRRFEQVLQSINESIEKIVNEGINIPIKEFNSVIGIVYDNQVFLSGLGNIQALFMHKTAKQRYIVYELDKQFSDNELPKWNKPFLTVLDGELHQGDLLFISTRISAHELSPGDIQDTLVTLPPSGALKRIQQYLNIDNFFGAICIKIQDKPIQNKFKKVNPITSIKELGKTKETTSNMLGEQSPDVTGLIAKIVSPIIKKLSDPGNTGFKAVMKRVFKNIIKLLIKLISILQKMSISLFEIIKKVFKHIIRLVKKPTQRKKAKEDIVSTALNVSEKFKKIPLSIKIITPILILLVVTGATILNFNSKKKETRQLEITYQTIITKIQEKNDAAEASLIYGNKNETRNLLKEASSLLETIEQTPTSKISDIEKLQTQINNIYTQLRGIENVNLKLLADVITTDPNASFVASSYVNSVIYGIAQTGQLYRFQELENKFIKENVTIGAVQNIKNATTNKNGFLLVDSNNQLSRVDVTVNSIKPIVSGINKLTSVEDIFSFNDNLYSLSSATKQIIKMRPQGDGFEGGTPWISSSTSDLSDLKQLVIDGDIYILTSNKILKFSSGREQNFTLQKIDPPLLDPIDIWTEKNDNFLYVLDSKQERIIIYKKDGTLVTQYSNPNFKNAINIIPRPDKNQIIVVTKTQIYSFTASHLLQ